jgi:rare lipoprotein A
MKVRIIGAVCGVVALAASSGLVPASPGAQGTRVAPVHEQGKVSWYGERWTGRKTASGEPFDPRALTMAHRTLPLGTRVKVTNPENDRSVIVRVNDRGPFVAGRVGDLSRAAAERLDMIDDGVIEAELQVVAFADTSR